MVKVKKKIGSIPIQTIKETVQQQVDASVSKMQDDVTAFIEEKTAEYPEIGGALQFKEDPEERSEITTDADGKVLSYRKKDGTKYENAIETDKLKFTEEGLDEFKNHIKVTGDWSSYMSHDGDYPLHIPMPELARVNIIGNVLPTTKFNNYEVVFEFWDMQGNYFKKNAIINAQGRSSLSHAKKNFAVDLFDNEFNGDAFAVRFGDLVPQDSFHLKAYYTDPFRCIGLYGYYLFDEIVRTRGLREDYIWKKALINYSGINATSVGELDVDNVLSQVDSGAKCFPYGFPTTLYFNGKFYGIYMLQLKKHRKNYMLDKKTPENVHLDGIINGDTLFNANGNASLITWTTSSPEGFEIRNPSSLILMDGSKYDADNNGGELIDSTSPVYSESDKNHVNSAKVKQIILNFSKVIPTLEEAYNTYKSSNKTEEDLAAFKTVFEKYFDPDSLIDYTIFSNVVRNSDGLWGNNYQIFTYDGIKWYVAPYDLDSIFGHSWTDGQESFVAPETTIIQKSFAMLKYIYECYGKKADERYAELRDAGIIDYKHISNSLNKFVMTIGKDNYELEYDKWNNANIYDSIYRVEEWIKQSIENMDKIYNYNK